MFNFVAIMVVIAMIILFGIIFYLVQEWKVWKEMERRGYSAEEIATMNTVDLWFTV